MRYAYIPGFPVGSVSKESACNAGDAGRPNFNPWFGKIPWRRARQPAPVFLPGESHGQRSLVGYSPWGCKGSELKRLNMHASLYPSFHVLPRSFAKVISLLHKTIIFGHLPCCLLPKEHNLVHLSASPSLLPLGCVSGAAILS